MTSSFVVAEAERQREQDARRAVATPPAPRLVVGAADDRTEVEADRVADEVVAALAGRRDRGVEAPPADGGRIRRAVAVSRTDGAAPTRRIRRATERGVIRRLLDADYEEDVFDIAQGKRDAELADMRGRGPGVGPARPGRDVIEQHFAGKGTRSYPAAGPGPRDPGRAVPTGTPVATTLAPVIILGPDASTGAKLPAEADAEHELTAIADAAKALYPTLDIDRDVLAESRNIRHRAKRTHQGTSAGKDVGDDSAYYANVIARFRTRVDDAIERDFVAGAGNAEMAQLAMTRAKLDTSTPARPRAEVLYHQLYEAVAFDAAKVGHITAASAEQPLLTLCGSLAAADRAAFVAAAAASAEILAFALAHQAELTGQAGAAAVLRCWHACPTVLTSVADCRTVLAFALVNNEAAKAVTVAKLIGTPQIPTVAAMTTIMSSGLFASTVEIRRVAALGGDVVTSKRLLDIAATAKLKDEEVQAFNAKAGLTLAEATQCWTLLSAHVGDDDKKVQLVRSLVRAEHGTRAHFVTFVQQFGNLMNRTTVAAATVVQLLNAGLLTATGRIYDSNKQGKGCTYVFNLAGQGRLTPEWHIHFKSSGSRKSAEAVGTGWKNASEKYDPGVKSFSPGTAQLRACLEALGYWRGVSF